MGRQVGLFKIKGKLGGVSFFKRQGEDHARLVGGVSKERILTDPKFKRTRENMSEFGGLAKALKSFRAAIAKVGVFKDGTLGPRLTRLFRAIMKRAAGVRGKRPVLLSQNKSLLQGFELNSGTELFSVFSVPLSSASAARNKVTATISELNNDMIEAPETATHFRLVQLMAVVADIVYDEATQKFQAANINDGISAVSYSDYLPVTGTLPATLSIDTAVDLKNVDEGFTCIHALGIVFYDKVDTEYYSLAQNAAMKIIGVY